MVSGKLLIQVLFVFLALDGSVEKYTSMRGFFIKVTLQSDFSDFSLYYKNMGSLCIVFIKVILQSAYKVTLVTSVYITKIRETCEWF